MPKISKIKRVPKNAIADEADIYEIIDKHYLCHVGFVEKGKPLVIPTLYGRKDDFIFIHGASVSRLVTTLETGLPVSLSLAEVNGLVLARSLFHHSVNYESVVISGTAQLIQGDEEKIAALKIISDQIIKDRWQEARFPNEQELKATKVLKIKIENFSAKVRTGDPKDEAGDYDLDIWAGTLPITKNYAVPVPDANLKTKLKDSSALPKSLVSIMGKPLK